MFPNWGNHTMIILIMGHLQGTGGQLENKADV